MSNFTRTFLTCSALLLSSLATAQPTSTLPVKPNIIYIYADDLGYGEIGAYGQEKIKTPNLDRLAAEGLKFTRHYSAAPLCSPARCSLLTGLHTGHSVIRYNYEFGGFTDDTERGQMPLPPHTVTVGTILQDAGYATGCVGKWGLGMNDTSGHPNRQGFNYFFGFLDQKQPHNYYPTHLWENSTRVDLDNPFVDVHELKGKADPNVDFTKYQSGDHACDHIKAKALQFIDDHSSSPFFLYYASPIPHLSLQPKQEFLEKYLEQFPDDPPYLGDTRYAPHPHPHAAYAAMISMLDANVGAIIAKVRQLGLEQNTIIMFSSDNGTSNKKGGVDPEFFNSTAGLRGTKHTLYEGGIRMPMIARWPGHIQPGTTTDHVSAQYDVLPTLCDLLDIPVPEPVDGISFLPTLLGKSREQRTHDFLYWEIPSAGGKQAVLQYPWKTIRTAVNGDPDTPWELYNLETDSAESNDIAKEHPNKVSQLNALATKAHWHPTLSEWEFINPKSNPKPKSKTTDE